MATEEGIVTKISGQASQTAWVKTSQSSACKSCSSRHSCNPEMGSEREVEAINLVGAEVGDRIQISIETGSLLKATFLLYVFPVICMLCGGLVGNRLSAYMGLDPSPAAALVAVISFGGAMVVVRLRGKRMASETEYRPKITRIIGKAA
ncbi:MAG: SoxR reducing system RseC family protein [Desulfobacteraceae bacterium]